MLLLFGGRGSPVPHARPQIAEGDEEVVALQTGGRIWEMVFMLGSTIVFVAVGMVGGLDLLQTCHVASAFTGVQGIAGIYLAWQRLEDRPALHEGRADLLHVFSQMWKTIKIPENKHVRQYLVGMAFLDAGNGNMLGLLSVYAMQQVEIDNPTV
jgi:hypothetical protein